MKTLLALAIIVTGILLPSSVSAMRYDRINPSLPGLCMTKGFAKKASKFCYQVGPAVGRR